MTPLKTLPGLMLMALIALLASCNSDNDIIPGNRPTIEFDSPDGVYTVRVGHELRIDPIVSNASNAEFVWTMDGKTISTERALVMQWNRLGSYYVMLTVTSPAGSASEEARIDVVDSTPPVIDYAEPSAGIYVLAGEDYVIAPRYQHSDVEGFRVSWSVDGKDAGEGESFTFNRTTTGAYQVTAVAVNEDGSDEMTVTVNVVDQLPRSLSFASPSIIYPSDRRYTFAGRAVVLIPDRYNIPADAKLKWSVDGKAVAEGDSFEFTPDAAGEYVVTVEADGVQASVTVVCVDATEASRRRTGGSMTAADKVWEYIPAPGQFIGDSSTEGGMPDDVTTHDAATAWAKSRMDNHLPVSLGACGGYIVVGFDHSVAAGGGDYDIAIRGNAFDTSNEPGTVWVSQDVNGNGLPDDEWYELRGSEYDNPLTIRNYAVTYYRPSGSEMDVEWTDNLGGRGLINYLLTYHSQPSYYPAWITSRCYTLRCSRLPANGVLNTVTGQWNTNPLPWGYADNRGSDLMAAGSVADGGAGQITGLKISNAVMANGKPIELQYADFVCVRSGVMQQLGSIGESSTEVCGISDCH